MAKEIGDRIVGRDNTALRTVRPYRQGCSVITVTFITANFVARELGYTMPGGWGQGDRATRERFRPAVTFGSRFAALLDEVVALGFDAIDLWNAHLDPGWATDAHIAEAREALRDRGLHVASLAGGLGDSRERLEATCRVAVALGAGVLAGGTPLLADDRAFLVQTLERHGLVFGVENHPERTPAEMLLQIGDTGGGRIGTTVDTGWYGTQGYDAARAIDELTPHVVGVHLKDVRHVGMPHETCRYGQGVVPLRRCVQALRRNGYTGTISVEHEPEDFDPSEDVRTSREMLEAWLADPPR
ncbi:MAG: sugar phosphate isomerase/epimerase [Actinomycetota bacterium]|nr:sugar phosphate isomerase/epimerase [Actinomycetota bacterium]